MNLSGDEDASIDDLSDAADGSDDGLFIDASPQSAGSPVLGARLAGRVDSQPAPAAGPRRPPSSPAAARDPAPETLPGPELSPHELEPGALLGAVSRLHPSLAPAVGLGPAPDLEPGFSSAAAPAAPGAGQALAPERSEHTELMDTAEDRHGGSRGGVLDGPDVELEPDSDVEIIPVEEVVHLESGRAAGSSARRSIGASAVWRDTDFRDVMRVVSVDSGEGVAATGRTSGSPARSSEAVAAPPSAAVVSAAGPLAGQKTPVKAEGGFVPGADVRSPGSEDGQCCTICFEPWSNSGEHRISALRCGHLFGKSCIERWLKGRDQRCPQCNAKACRRDVRVIFAKSLRVLDTTDRDRALEELDRERETRRRLELDFAVVQVKCQMKGNQVEKLQAELRALRERVGCPDGGGGAGGGGSQPGPPPPAGGAKLSLQCSLEVSRPGGCRVMEYNSWLGMLVASQPSQNTLFPGHGVRKINTLDMRALQFVSLHQKQIRDVRFSPDQRDLLLSVSLDKRAKITNLCGNTLVQTYECAAPVWSCAWDRDAPHTFYAGLQSGAVLAFDTRAGTEPLQEMAGGSPVVSLRHVARGGTDATGGLLVCRLATCSLQEVAGERRTHELPLHGPFVSADFDERTRHLLVSSRPSSRQPHAQHTVCRLRRVRLDGAPRPPLVSAEVVQVFRGGTSQRVLSRSALVPNPLRPDAPLICASQETAQVTQLWDLASGECAVTLAASEPVLDACPLAVQDRHYLALLTEKAVKMYRWEVT